VRFFTNSSGHPACVVNRGRRIGSQKLYGRKGFFKICLQDPRDLPEDSSAAARAEGEEVAGAEVRRKAAELQRHEERLHPLHDQRLRG
jgi:hypothetical protein